MTPERLTELQNDANEIRKLIIEMIGRLGVGHIGGSLSIVEVLTAIYRECAKVDPKNPKWPERDRIVLSKGHGGPGLYATLAYCGYFDKSELATLNRPNTNLPSHCDMNKTIGVDMTAGSLAQGFSASVGMALAARLDKLPCNIYAIIGDGESQEGQIWEASMYAAQNKLSNMIAFTDRNGMQIDGMVEEINGLRCAVAKWDAFGWFVQKVDGHDIAAIVEAINVAKAQKEKPNMIILETVKGKGAYFCENQVTSHSMNVSEEMWKTAVSELSQ